VQAASQLQDPYFIIFFGNIQMKFSSASFFAQADKKAFSLYFLFIFSQLQQPA
jgi:hypothetical protein